MTEDDRAKELLGYLHGHMHEKAKELKIRGISADADRMRRLFGEGKHQASFQFCRDSSPVAWRVDGDKRYPVYPGYEDFDPYIGPNGLQELINREGIDYTFDEGSTSADNSDVELMDLLRGINHSEAPRGGRLLEAGHCLPSMTRDLSGPVGSTPTRGSLITSSSKRTPRSTSTVVPYVRRLANRC